VHTLQEVYIELFGKEVCLSMSLPTPPHTHTPLALHARLQ
jgi:hypothetical protein